MARMGYCRKTGRTVALDQESDFRKRPGPRRGSFRIAFSFVVILFAFFLVVLLLFVIFFFGDFSKQGVGGDHTISRNRKMYSAHSQWYARSLKRYSVLIRKTLTESFGR